MSLSIQPLTKQDTILVVSPSGKVNKSLVEKSIGYLEQFGFTIELGRYVFDENYKYAGTHQQRLSDLQWALDHPTAKAIFCSRGGYGITHLIDQLNFSGFSQYPKWVIGYSDITALHSLLYLKGYQSIHASVLQGLLSTSEEDVKALCNTLLGKQPDIRLPHELRNRNGSKEAVVVGGNLSMLVNQIGTPSELSLEGKILFLEEVGEYLYHIDRILVQLKRANKLAKLSGLIVGSFSNLKETSAQFGQSLEDIILDHCSAFDFPIVFNFPIGHSKRNWPIIHGVKVKLSVTADGTSLTYF